MEIADRLWPEEREAARPRDRGTVADWCERHVVLDAANHAHPGPLRFDRTPYLREMVNAWDDPDVRRIVVMGSTQWGKTIAAMCVLFRTIAERPRPILWVMPNERDVISFASNRLARAIDLCRPVRARMGARKGDRLREELRFFGGKLKFAWPSPSRLASDSIGALIADEISKLPRWIGEEGDPLQQARERLRWWTDSKEWNSSTPTVAGDAIDEAFQQSDRRRYWVPCPRCDAYQILKFEPTTLQWPDDERDPDRIERERLAWYVCEHCGGNIEDDDDTRAAMLSRGVWVPEGGHVDARGRAAGVRLDAAVRGFHLNALYSPMITWSATAAQFLRSKDRPERLQSFVTLWLGQPWQDSDVEVRLERLPKRATDDPVGVVPHGAIALTAGADVQEHGIYWAVRAHWPGGRSHTVEAGIAETFEDLRLLVLERDWPRRDPEQNPARVALLCVDTGYRTDEVYQWTRSIDRARPVKGEDGDEAGIPYRQTRVERTLAGKPVGLMLWLVRVAYYKSRLARRMNAPEDSAERWNVHANPPTDYLRQIASEHRAIQRNRKTGAVRTVWTIRPGGGGNHWWDCEVYADAAADMLQLYRLRSEADVAELQAARARERVQREAARASSDRRERIAARIRENRKRRGGRG